MFNKKYLFVVIILLIILISISFLLDYSFLKKNNSEYMLKIRDLDNEIENLRNERDNLLEIINKDSNKPMKELEKGQVTLIKQYLNEYYENPDAVDIDELTFLLKTALRENLSLEEVRTVLSQIDQKNYNKTEAGIPFMYGVMTQYYMFTYKSPILRMKIYFYGSRVEGYEIILLSKYPNKRKMIELNNTKIDSNYFYEGPIRLGKLFDRTEWHGTGLPPGLSNMEYLKDYLENKDKEKK